MTGTNSTSGEKLRAVFLASLMVLSVFAMSVAFTGSVAAAGNASFTASPNTAGSSADLTGGLNVGSEYAGSSFQTMRLDFTPASNFDGSFSGVADSDVDITVNGASQGATVDSISNGGATITVSMGSQMTVQDGDRINVVISNTAFQNPSTDGDYSGLIHINPSSSAGKAYANLQIGAGGNADGYVKKTADTATAPSVDNFDNVGDDVEVAVDNSTFNDQTLSVKHYADGELVNEVTLTDGDGDNIFNATLSAAKRGTVEFYNGSQLFETKGYTAENYTVKVINNATYATTDSVQINGEIYRYYDEDGVQLLENTSNVDYAIYEPGNKTAGNQIATGDTSSGKFTEVRTFSATPNATSPPPGRTEDFDYPADGQTAPAYEVFVKQDVDNNNAPTPDVNTNDGSAIIPVRVNFDLTGPSDVNYGETRDVTGLLTTGDGDGIANYFVEIQNGTVADANIGMGKTRNTTTAADGEFAVTLEFNDAGIWTYGTNVGDKSDNLDDSIRYGEIPVAGQEASITLETNDINRANFTHSYDIQVNDTDGTALHVDEVDNPAASGYVKITGPFEGNVSNGGFTAANVTTGDYRASVDPDNDGDTEVVHVYTNAQGQIGFDATPAGEVGSEITASLESDNDANPFNGVYDGVENTVDAGDTPEYPDYVGNTSLEVVAPDDINLVEYKVQDPRTGVSSGYANQPTGNYTDAINEFGPTDGGPDNYIEVLPLTIENSSRIVNGFRLGNDTYQDFEGMTAYRLRFALRDSANNPITPGTDPGEVASISLEGAGVSGTVSGLDSSNDFDAFNDLSLDSGSQNILPFPKHASGTPADTYSIVFRPTNADEVDETIDVEVNVSGTGSAVDIAKQINVSGLYVEQFEVDGEEVNTVDPNSEVDVTAVVRDKQEGDAYINNGRVRVSQNGTALGQIDARTANVNNGQYTFDNLQVGPRGIDTDGDGIGEDVSELVFTAYQYEDANNNQALQQDEVDEATVETLNLGLETDLNVTFLPDDPNTSDYVGSKFGGQMVLTKGVEYDSIAFKLGDGEGNDVNLTDGMGQKVSLNNLPSSLVNVTALDINGNQVTGTITFNETASQPGDGYYVIEDISSFNTLVSDDNGANATAGATGANDGVFSFYDYGATGEGPQQFWLRITTPDLSEATEAITPDAFEQSEGEFQVGDPMLNTTVTGVAGPGVNDMTWGDLAHNASDNLTEVSDVETMTIGVNRTYRVNATYLSFDGEAINGSEFAKSWIQYKGPLSDDGADTQFAAVSTIGNSPATIYGNPTVNMNNGFGEFQFDIAVNSSGGDGTFTPEFTMNATGHVDYGKTKPYAPNYPNATIIGTPVAQNAIVEVYDQSGSSLPVSNDTGNQILANDVRQTLRVEAFPADGDDVPLRSGLAFGFRNTAPISQNVVGTITSTATADELVTDNVLGEEYTEGQLGFLTLTPTGTGDAIMGLINDDDGTGTLVQNTDAENILFDVNRANLQLDITLSTSSVDAGDNVTVTLSSRATGDDIARAGVSLVDPNGNVIEEATTDGNGEVTFTVPENATDGTYTIESRPAGYQPNSVELGVAGVDDEDFSVGNNPPANNLDSDSYLEDVDGDGDADVFDALTYYNNRNSDVIQNNPAQFNYDGQSPVGTVFDALELYNKIQSL